MRAKLRSRRTRLQSVLILAVDRTKLADYCLPSLLYLVGYYVGRLVGFGEVRIPWTYYQLLDRQHLLETPLDSLLLLHSQPPLLNGLVSLLLRLSGPPSTTPEQLATALFFLLGLLFAILFHFSAIVITGSRKLALAGLAAILTTPSFPYFQTILFYPYLLLTQLALLLFLSAPALAGCDSRRVLLAPLALAIIVNTRSLFHPLWALSIFFLLLWSQRGSRRIRLFCLSGGIMVLFLVGWPLKNYALFNEFTFSTWTGVNLARGFPVRSNLILEFFTSGKLPAEIEHEIRGFERRFGYESTGVIREAEKSNGRRNWNHLVFARANADLSGRAVRYRLEHPSTWFWKSVGHYLKWTRASYVHPYNDQILGPKASSYGLYARLHHHLFFQDLRPLFQNLLPGDESDPRFLLRGRALPISLFGVGIFPLIMTASLVVAIWELRGGNVGGFRTIVFLWFTVLWLLLVPCLTDGQEGNRMRFSGEPYLVLLVLLLWKKGVEMAKGFLPSAPLPGLRGAGEDDG